MTNSDKTNNELLKELQELRQENNSLKAANTDISKYKEAEAALVASEIRYRRLFESAKDGILILDADLVLLAMGFLHPFHEGLADNQALT